MTHPELLPWNGVTPLTRDQLRSAAGTPPDHPEAPGDKERWHDFPTFFFIPDFLKTGDRRCPLCLDMVTPGKTPIQIACARGCSICLKCLYTWRESVREYSPQTLDRCLKCQGFMVEVDNEKDQAYHIRTLAPYAQQS